MSDELKLRRDPDIQALLNRISILERRVWALEQAVVPPQLDFVVEAQKHSHNCRWFEYQACDCGAHDK